MKRALGLVTVILLACSAGWSQQVPADNSPATKDDVEKLFVTLHLRDMMQNMMASSMQQSKQLAHDALKKKGVEMTEDQLKRIDEMIDKFAKSLDLAGLLDDMVPVYQHHLTRDDVRAMLAFYDTPTGQKILREQPAMMAEGMQAMRPRMEKMMSDIMDEAERVAKEETKDSKPANKQPD
jgi:hypothetical protein